MNQSTLKRSLFFLAVFACIQIPIAAKGQAAARSNYQAINAKQFLADRKITVSNPKDIAAKLFSSDRESEGRKSDQILPGNAYPEALPPQSPARQSLWTSVPRLCLVTR